jgi:MFS family permease
MMLLAVISYIPLLVQAGLGLSINDSRNILDAFLLPMIAGAFIGGSLTSRTGYRTLTATGMVIATIGAFMLIFVNAASGVNLIAEAVVVVGVGVGITFSPTFLVIQNSAKRSEMGVASSLAQFMGNLGGTIGLAILGTVQANTFSSNLANVLQGVPDQFRTQFSALLGNANVAGQILSSPSALAQLTSQYPAIAQIIPQLRAAFVNSVTPLFTAGLVIAIIGLVASFAMGGSLKEQMAKNLEAVPASKSD